MSFIQSARRAQIIAAAIETVTAVGYGQASLARIADHANISKSVISYHFANKADLLEQVVAQVHADWAAFLQPFLDAEATARGRLAAYIRCRLTYLQDHRIHLVAVAEITRNHRGPDGQLVFTERSAQPVDELLTILRAGQRAGEFRAFDPVVVATAVIHSIDGVLASSAPDTDLATSAAELVTLFDQATLRSRS